MYFIRDFSIDKRKMGKSKIIFLRFNEKQKMWKNPLFTYVYGVLFIGCNGQIYFIHFSTELTFW